MKHCLLISSLLLLFGNVKTQVPDSLFTQARDVNKTAKERVILYDEIGYQTSHFNIEEAILYADTAVQIARKKGDSSLVAYALNGQSIPHLRTGSFSKTQSILYAALLADTSDINLTARILGKLAKVEQELGNWDQAMQTYMRCYDIFKQTEDAKNVGVACNHIAMLYVRQNKLDRAEKYIREAIAIHQKDEDTFNYASACKSLSQLFEEQNRLDSALIYAQLNTQLISQLNRKPELGGALINEATILFKLKRLSEAKGLFENALAIGEEIGDESDIMFAAKNLGAIYYKEKDFKKAKPLLQRAAMIGEKMNHLEKLINTYQFLTDIALLDGDMDAVKEYREKYERGLAARYDIEESKKLAELNAKFEIAEQKALVSEKELKIKNGEARIARQQLQNFGLIAIVVLLLFLGLVVYSRIKAKQELALNKAVFREKEMGFAQIIEATEFERDRISKDLHDGMGQQLTALKLSLNSFAKNVGDEHQEEMASLIEYFTKSSEDLRLLSHQMMPRMLMDFGLPEAIEDLLRNSFLHAKIDYEFHHKSLTERLDKNVEIAVYRVVQELINNVLKHSEAKTFSVQLIRSDKKLAGFILDDGIGFNSDYLGEGHGLRNMKSRLALINGTLDIDSSPNKGTSISLSIPL